MTIELTPEIVAPLAIRAQQRGLTPEETAREILRAELGAVNGAGSVTNGAEIGAEEPELEAVPRTLADLFAGRIGVVDSGLLVPGGANMSQDPGRKFAAGMLEKRRLNKL